MRIPIIFSILLITISGHSQNLTYKDIIGKWEQIDTAVTHRNYVVTYEFLDSVHLIWNINGEGMPSLFYTIENGRGSARLLLNIEGHFIINHSGEAHRVSLKNDTLTIYDCYFPFPEGVKLETITMVKRQ